MRCGPINAHDVVRDNPFFLFSRVRAIALVEEQDVVALEEVDADFEDC